MINTGSNYDAVVCCDCCLKELARGRYPMDAEEYIGSEHFIISDPDKGPNEHYCNECYQLQQEPDKDEFIDKHLSKIKELIVFYK